jgi:hypothetical protein
VRCNLREKQQYSWMIKMKLSVKIAYVLLAVGFLLPVIMLELGSPHVTSIEISELKDSILLTSIGIDVQRISHNGIRALRSIPYAAPLVMAVALYAAVMLAKSPLKAGRSISFALAKMAFGSLVLLLITISPVLWMGVGEFTLHLINGRGAAIKILVMSANFILWSTSSVLLFIRLIKHIRGNHAND